MGTINPANTAEEVETPELCKLPDDYKTGFNNEEI